MFRHAPVTGCAIAGSALLSSLVPSSSLLHSPWYSGVSFPVGIFPTEVADTVIVVGILFHCRVLERHWGSARFIAFNAIPAIFSAVALQLVVGRNMFARGPQQAAALSVLRWTVLLSALSFRYFTDIPSLGRSKFGGITVSDKIVFYLLLVKFILLPAPAANRTTLLSCQIGLAILGVVIGRVMSSHPLSHISLPPHGVLMSTFRGLTAGLFGSEGEARHVAPRQRGNDGMQNDAGEVLVGDNRRQRRTATPVRRRAPAPPNSYDAEVGLIMSLQLPGVDVEQAHRALQATGGNVDSAVAMLMDQHSE